jgi:nuclear transport factor 2 (NTF2) superfamily protein
LDVATTSVELTLPEAERLVKLYEVRAGSGNPDRIIESFAPDVVVRFADFTEIHGLAELKHFIAARIARQKNYRLTKQLRAVAGNTIICSWIGAWEDGQNGQRMEGAGVEFMTLRDGKIILWEAVFNVWEPGKRGLLPIV